MSSKQSSFSSASSARKRQVAARLQQSRLLAQTSQGATLSGTEIRGVTSGGVSGESGGGVLKPTTLFDKQQQARVNGGTSVQAIVFPDSGICGAVIGQGMFFCLRGTPCSYASHGRAEIVGKAGSLYVPTTGAAPTAFCFPCLDSTTLDSRMKDLILSKDYKDVKLKALFSTLSEDPLAMTVSEASEFLEENETTDTFKEQVKAAMTPAKVQIDPDAALDEDARTLSESCNDLLQAVENCIKDAKKQVPLMEDASVPSDVDFNNFISIYNEGQALLHESVALLNWASGEIETVQRASNDISLRLNTSVGNDPGIGQYDQAGTFSSAWEGIQYVNNCVRTVDDTYGRAKLESLQAINLFRTTLDHVTDKYRERESLLNTRIMEPSGRYANDLDQHVKSIVEATLDAWLNDAAISGDESANNHTNDNQQGFGNVGGNGGGNGPNDGHNALVSTGGSGGNVQSELGVSAELDRLRAEVKDLRSEVEYLKSVTSTGSIKFELTSLEFDSEKSLLDYLIATDKVLALPSDLHVLCMDFWAALDYACSTVDGEDRQSSDAQLAKQIEAATKAKFNSAESLSRQCGFRRQLPLAVEPHNTPVSPDPVTTPLPGVKKYTDLDNRGEGQPGRKQMIMDEFNSHLSTTKTAIRDNLKSAEHKDLREFLEAFLSSVKDHNQLFFEWVKNAYDYERRNCAEAESWALVGGYIRAIFSDMRDARLVGRATSGLTGFAKEARLMWAMGMGAMKFQEFCDVKFQAHPSCVAVHTQYITRARTPMSAHKALEQKFKTLNGEFAKLLGAVEKLKKAKTGGGGGGTGGGQSGGN